MRLDDIGFYTLSDYRAKASSMCTPLYRCEMLLTDRCNFKCPYCRGLSNGRDLDIKEAKRILYYWISEGLKNVRFSGGEPTLYKGLMDLVMIAKSNSVEHIAISTNGSADIGFYYDLIESGVNDVSISLDACCSSTGDTMAGKKGAWDKVIHNIAEIAKYSYTTVGIVLNEENIEETEKTIYLAHSLGVHDIRVIPSAQYSSRLNKIHIVPWVLDVHKILKYRLTNERPVRGLFADDAHKCKLVLDDMAVWNGNHYPCIIYLREGGLPIGEVNERTRQDRYDWYIHHDSFNDVICKSNCLDVCVEFNNRGAENEKTHCNPFGDIFYNRIFNI